MKERQRIQNPGAQNPVSLQGPQGYMRWVDSPFVPLEQPDPPKQAAMGSSFRRTRHTLLNAYFENKTGCKEQLQYFWAPNK